MVTGRGEIKIEGFALALLGFLLSRLAVAESIGVADPFPFVLSELPSLLVGLGLAVAGVVLAVGPASRAYVRTVTISAFLGTALMIAATSLTVVGVALRGESVVDMVVSNMLVANVVLAGAIGGAILGDRSAKNQRYRSEIQRQADRARFMNRLLRHEVLNAAQVIHGYANLTSGEEAGHSSGVIQDAASRINETIGEIGELADERHDTFAPVDLSAIVTETVTQFDDENISASVSSDGYVLADHRLRWVVAELIENARHHGRAIGNQATPDITVNVETTGGIVTLSVKDNGPGLSSNTVRLLEDGDFPDYDDPSSGFGLQSVRLLIDAYGGEIEVDGSGGTKILLHLPRVNSDGRPISGVRTRSDEIAISAIGGLMAGVLMGVYLQTTAGMLPVIGALYGIESELVGWITHLFHSVVFGLLFAAGLSRPRMARFKGIVGQTGLGIGWGILLWLIAAGLVMPVWLQLTGVEAALPNLTLPGLIGHVIWGGVLGLLYSVVTSEMSDNISIPFVERYLSSRTQ